MVKNKGISFRLSESEYDKVQDLADQRHMTVTEYIRHTALGNRIKPTVVQKKISESNVQALEDENQKLKNGNREMLRILDSIEGHIADNGFMNWHDYKNDEQAINALKKIKTIIEKVKYEKDRIG